MSTKNPWEAKVSIGSPINSSNNLQAGAIYTVSVIYK